NRSGGGDVVIIRASGTDAYNAYVNKLGKVNSVETLKIDSRKLADDERVARIIRNAEMLFIAGGDQADYVGYGKDAKTMQAIDYLLTEKKVPRSEERRVGKERKTMCVTRLAVNNRR